MVLSFFVLLFILFKKVFIEDANITQIVLQSGPQLTKNIYIQPFSKTFSYGEIYRYIYILLFSCTCARVHFSLVIVQLVKKLGSTINFFFVGFFCSNLKRTCRFAFFFFF